MKQLVILSAIFAMQTSAFAQSSATVAVPAAVKTAAAPAAATSTTDAAPATSVVHAGYEAIMFGPGLSTEDRMTQKDGSDMHLSHRPKVKFDITKSIDAGLQARIGNDFTETGLIAANENWKLFADFKNVYSQGIVSLTLVPKAILPFSNAAHNRTMLPSAELLAPVSVNPTDSRFSFCYTPQMQQYFYSNKQASATSMNFYLLHNLEGTYTLGSTTQITFGYYPEYASFKNKAFTNTSNEIDVGINWDFAKGWSINPAIATELNGIDSSAIGKNMQANLTLSGSFL